MSQQNSLDKNLASLLPRHLDAKDKELQNGYVDFKKNVTLRAIKILTEVIPERIRHFNALSPITGDAGLAADASDFPECDFYKIPNIDVTPDEEVVNQHGKRIKTDPNFCEEAPAGSTMKLSKYIYTCRVPFNPHLEERMNQIKKNATELLDLVASVKLWIQLNIPKIEDGNNFGVAIQEDVISELTRVEDAAFGFREAIGKYYTHRAKLITKVVKYPNVADYRMALRELDEKQWFQLKVTNMDTRNNYAIIFDMLHKNWNKVVKPRSGDGSMMVY